MYEFNFQNLKLRYEVHGEGSLPLIFFHANGYSSGCYRPLFAKLSKQRKVYALNYSGHGGSERFGDFKDWFFYRDQARDFIEFVLKEHNSVHIAGHSLGGATALLAAATNQERILSVSVLDPVVLSPLTVHLLRFIPHPLANKAEKRRNFFHSQEVIRRSFRIHPGFKNWHRDSFQGYLETAFIPVENGYELSLPPAHEAHNFRCLPTSQWKHFKSLKVPIRVIPATRSEVCPHRSARLLSKKNKVSDYIYYPECNHLFPMEDPEWTSNRISEFIETCEITQKINNRAS